MYEIFSSRSEVILQAFVNEMYSLARKHAAFEQLMDEPVGKEKPEWVQDLDRIFDLVNSILEGESEARRTHSILIRF